MDRDTDSLENSPPFSHRRLWLTLAASAAVLTVGSLVVRSFPNSGYQAGYDAVVDKGANWVTERLGAAPDTALPACTALHKEVDSDPGEPRYEYDSFVRGCGAAVDHLLGRHVPLLPAGR